MPRTKFHANGSNGATTNSQKNGKHSPETSKANIEPEMHELLQETTAHSEWDISEANSDQLGEPQPQSSLMTRAEAMALLNISDEIIFEMLLKQAGLDRKATQFEAEKIEAIAESSNPMLTRARAPIPQPEATAAFNNWAPLAEVADSESAPKAEDASLPKRGSSMGRAIDVHEQIASGSFEELAQSYEALNAEQAVELLERGEVAFRTVLTEGTLALHQVRMGFVNQMTQQSLATTSKLVEDAEALEKRLNAERQASASRTAKARQSSTQADFFKALSVRMKQK